jgi:hypothetical protein
VKLWNDGKAGSAGSAIRATVKGQVAKINRQVVARGVRAVNAMRNAELEVLKGQRSGRTYRSQTAQQSDLHSFGTRRTTGKTYRKSPYALEWPGKE